MSFYGGARNRGKERGEYEELEGMRRRRGILTTGEWSAIVSQLQSAICCTMCKRGFEWGLGTRGLRMVAAFWPGIPVEVTQEIDVEPAVDAIPSGDPFSRLIQRTEKRWAYSAPLHPPYPPLTPLPPAYRG